jgi:AcrR family transcriptional regulator
MLRREEKVNKIMQATLEVLSRSGYENTTINEIADTAKISRGLLHYYFKDKEDLVAQSLGFGFGPMWDSSIGSLAAARSSQELAEKMISVLKKNVKENPDFSALLFEMWVSTRRSNRIRGVFNNGLSEAIRRLQNLLKIASSLGIVNIKPEDAEGMIRILFALYHGLAIQLLADPSKVDDENLWRPVRNLLMSAIEGNHEEGSKAD